jgi:hypothetical protein
VPRAAAGAYESDDLPSRAEMRLRKTGRAIGYTLSRIKDDEGALVGVTLSFKDLTRVEQIEERERLRDRLAALGEMAAAIAHEVKNPLASIEVMAGVLKRQLSEQSDAQDALNDIIKEAKMANSIVVEVLEFVRPIQLQVERVRARRRDQGFDHAGREQDAPRRRDDQHVARRGRARSCWPIRTSCAALFEPAGQRVRGARRRRARRHPGALVPGDDEPGRTASAGAAGRFVEVRDSGPGSPTISSASSVRFYEQAAGHGLGWRSCARCQAHDGTSTRVAPGRRRRFRVTLPVVPSRHMGRRTWDAFSSLTITIPAQRASVRALATRATTSRRRPTAPSRSSGCRTASSTSS